LGRWLKKESRIPLILITQAEGLDIRLEGKTNLQPAGRKVRNPREVILGLVGEPHEPRIARGHG
jgi:hypothetical protein